MAQLTDDCFAFNGPLLPIVEVERLIRDGVAPVAEIESVPLTAARGRVVARDIVAPLDLPPFDNSAAAGGRGYRVRAGGWGARRRGGARGGGARARRQPPPRRRGFARRRRDAAGGPAPDRGACRARRCRGAHAVGGPAAPAGCGVLN